MIVAASIRAGRRRLPAPSRPAAHSSGLFSGCGLYLGSYLGPFHWHPFLGLLVFWQTSISDVNRYIPSGNWAFRVSSSAESTS